MDVEHAVARVGVVTADSFVHEGILVYKRREHLYLVAIRRHLDLQHTFSH